MTTKARDVSTNDCKKGRAKPRNWKGIVISILSSYKKKTNIVFSFELQIHKGEAAEMNASVKWVLSDKK